MGVRIGVYGQGSVEISGEEQGLRIKFEAGGGREGTKPISAEVVLPAKKLGDLLKVMAGVEGSAGGLYKRTRWVAVMLEDGLRLKMRREENGEVYEGSIRFRGRNLLKLYSAIDREKEKVAMIVASFDGGVNIVKSQGSITVAGEEGAEVIFGSGLVEVIDFIKYRNKFYLPRYKGGMVEILEGEDGVKIGKVKFGEAELKVLGALL